MSGTFITRSTYEGLRLVGRKEIAAVDGWESLTDFISSEIDAQHAAILAEPQPLGGGRYAWYSAIDGEPVMMGDLAGDEKLALAASAEKLLVRLRALVTDPQAEPDRDRRDLLELLRAALSLPEGRLETSLYRIGGRPVLTGWGSRLDVPGARAEPLEIKLVEPARPVPPPPEPVVEPREPPTPWRWRWSWDWRWADLLWVVAAILIATVFGRLVSACGLMSSLGIGPAYCVSIARNEPPELASARQELADLMDRARLLQAQIRESPICGLGSPAFAPAKDPNAAPAAGQSEAQLHQELNDLVRNAGGAPCEAVEVLAIWSEAQDVDLRLICPAAPGAGDAIDPDRMVDPWGTQACGASYVLGSDGAAGGRHVEQICLSPESDRGEFLATVLRPEGTSGDAIPVRIIVRGEGIIAESTVQAAPDFNDNDTVRFQID